MEGTPKAIEMKGIVRNATKIGVQDGQAEDLINLRFVDGSWRASGDGRLVHTMSGTIYEQLYVHTNVYHHLLGVDNGTLYWFAEIDNNGVTFYPLDGTTDRSLWPEDKQGLPTERKALTTVVGDVWITQTGHLLTVIDEEDDFEYFIFRTDEETYTEVSVDTNGQPSDRSLYPFGGVHFNLRLQAGVYSKERDDQYIIPDGDDGDRQHSPACIPKEDESTTHAAAQIWHADMLEMFKKATDGNRFTAPFLALVAVKLYDGTYAFASNPVLLNPREKISLEEGIYYLPKGMGYYEGTEPNGSFGPYPTSHECYINDAGQFAFYSFLPVYSAGTSAWHNTSGGAEDVNNMRTDVWGADLFLHIDNIDVIKKNRNVFAGIGVFVTRQSNLYYQAADDYKKGEVKFAWKNYSDGISTINVINVAYAPGRRPKSEIIYDLLNSPFFLFREYNIDELDALKSNNRIDMVNDARFKGVLSTITSSKVLSYESQSRTTYIPKTSYSYNGRVHIANYKSYPFFGYPIDAFHLHNHSVVHSENVWFQDVLPNTAGNYDTYWQYTKDILQIENIPSLVEAGAPYFIVKVHIKSEQGNKVVCRYIKAYNPQEAPEHTANYIEDLNPILTYPDSNAYKMEIFYVRKNGLQGIICKKEFTLKPHPYLNIAYHIDPNLMPISLQTYDVDNYIYLIDNTLGINEQIRIDVEDETLLNPVLPEYPSWRPSLT